MPLLFTLAAFAIVWPDEDRGRTPPSFLGAKSVPTHDLDAADQRSEAGSALGTRRRPAASSFQIRRYEAAGSRHL
jgi:hypothetical protein